MTRVLSTRKLKGNQKQYLLHAGFSVIDADFISTETTAFSLDGVRDNLIFTSSTAVRAVAAHPNVQDIRRKPCFCVGDKTAALLDELGFTVVETASHAGELADTIKGSYRSEAFTFCCGNLRMETLPLSLKVAGIPFNEIEVYHTVLKPVAISGESDAILFFSPSGVESFLSANAVGNAVCFCIGQTTAAALMDKTENIIIANKPSVENVVIQCIKHFGPPKSGTNTAHPASRNLTSDDISKN